MPTVHLLIKGVVQGVYFRASAKREAEALGLVGWVKNTQEGHVEAIATGSEAALQDFVEWCKRGPEKAVVSTVSVASLPETPFPDFRIIKGK